MADAARTPRAVAWAMGRAPRGGVGGVARVGGATWLEGWERKKKGAAAINNPRFLIGRGEKWSHHVTRHLKIPRWRIPSRAESVGGARAAVSAPGPSTRSFLRRARRHPGQYAAPPSPHRLHPPGSAALLSPLRTAGRGAAPLRPRAFPPAGF